MSYGVVVVCYLAMGLVGGIIVGILRSLSHTRLGAIAIGLFVAVEAFWIVNLAISGLIGIRTHTSPQLFLSRFGV